MIFPSFRKRRLFQNLSELLLLLTFVGLFTLALSAEGAVIRRPVLGQDLADPPKVTVCLRKVLAEAEEANLSNARFAGPIISSDRKLASYALEAEGGHYRLDFTASEGHHWKMFTYGDELNPKLGASTTQMYGTAMITQAKEKVARIDLTPCVKYLLGP